jgi:hypothetical protein
LPITAIRYVKNSSEVKSEAKTLGLIYLTAHEDEVSDSKGSEWSQKESIANRGGTVELKTSRQIDTVARLVQSFTVKAARKFEKKIGFFGNTLFKTTFQSIFSIFQSISIYALTAKRQFKILLVQCFLASFQPLYRLNLVILRPPNFSGHDHFCGAPYLAKNLASSEQ